MAFGFNRIYGVWLAARIYHQRRDGNLQATHDQKERGVKDCILIQKEDKYRKEGRSC